MRDFDFATTLQRLKETSLFIYGSFVPICSWNNIWKHMQVFSVPIIANYKYLISLWD